MGSYWNNDGTHQALMDALWKLVPAMGEVENAKANPKLERLRNAAKVYYDIFNNGGGNRTREIKPTFGIRLGDYRNGGATSRLDFNRLQVDLEAPMSRYVLEAGREQVAALARGVLENVYSANADGKGVEVKDPAAGGTALMVLATALGVKTKWMEG